MVLVAVGLIIPKWYDIFVPVDRRNDGQLGYPPDIMLGTILGHTADDAQETGGAVATTPSVSDASGKDTGNQGDGSSDSPDKSVLTDENAPSDERRTATDRRGAQDDNTSTHQHIIIAPLTSPRETDDT